MYVYLWVVGNVESLDQENHCGRRPHCCAACSHSVCKYLFRLTNDIVVDKNDAFLLLDSCNYSDFTVMYSVYVTTD